VKDERSLKILGERIRRARRKTGLSQEELAFHADIDRSYMGGVERGERNLSFVKLCSIARVLKKDAGSLTKGLPADG
jgi:transcriptional regulator with XRE-family HTH domain